jgi:PAS domain S-box-containing protein
MWLRYLIAVILLAGLTVVSYLIVINLNLLNENNGKLVQASARQLTLAEQMGRLALRLGSPLEDGERAASRERLRQAIGELSAQHAVLRDGGLPPGGKAVFFDAPDSLDARLSAFTELASRLLGEAGLANLDVLRADAERVSAAVDGLTPVLRDLVKLYEQDGVEKIYAAIETETYVALAALLVLLLEIALIFRPIIGRVRRTAISLQQQALFNQNIIATTQAFVVGLDPQGRIVIFNRHGEEKTGWSQHDLVGTDFAGRFLPADQRSMFAALSAELFAGRREGEYEALCATRDGRALTVRWQLTAVRDPVDGLQLLLLATGVDLTEIKAAASRLEAALREARTLGERLREEVAHAAELQRSLLPSPAVGLPGMGGVALLTTCTEVGGDYYDYYSVGGRYAVVVIADGSGHGVAAGTLVNAAKIAVLQASERGETDPARILGMANRALLASTHDSMFMTMGCLCLDSATGLCAMPMPAMCFPMSAGIALGRHWRRPACR